LELHYTIRILGRRFALITTAYKYLDIGFNIGLVSYVNIILGDNKSDQISLSSETWTTIIEKRTDIERLLQSTSVSSLWIHLLVELEKIRNKSVVKFIFKNKCIYVKPSTVLFLLEHCV